MNKIDHPCRVTMIALALAMMATTEQTANAQADAWIAKSNDTPSASATWIDIPPTGNIVVEGGLPTPGGTFGYDGTPADYSQHIRTNGDGDLIFFAIDGNLYDGDGYLIADAISPSCNECSHPGVMEFLSVPVPGQCDLYYILASIPKSFQDNDYSHVQVSVLDMSEDNYRFSSSCPRKGRLLNLVDEEIETLHPDFAAWDFGEDFIDSESDYVGRLLSSATAKSITPIIRVISGSTESDPSWLFFILPNRVYTHKIAHNGIFLNTPAPGLSYIPTSSNDPAVHKQWFRDADVARLPNGQIRLVYVDGEILSEYPSDGVNYNLIDMVFTETSGTIALDNSQGHLVELPTCSSGPEPNIAAGLRGCALTANGSTAYLTGENSSDCINWYAFMKSLDLGSGVLTDHTSNIPNTVDYVRSRIYRNRSTSGQGDAIYFPHETGIAAYDLTTGVFSSGGLNASIPPKYSEYEGDGVFPPRFLGIGIINDQHLSANNKETCCTYFETVPGAVVGGYIHESGNETWTGTNNPLQPGTDELVFTCDLVIKTGTSLHLNDLTLKFAPDAKIIVERNGKLYMDNVRATSLTCPDQRWPGIRVEGNTANTWQSTVSQGYLRLIDSQIENARVGVWTARENGVGYADPAYFGGIISATSSRFYNCIVGAKIEQYHRLANLPNLCRFQFCDFLTTTEWPDLGISTPQYHAYLYDVRGVRFDRCNFGNYAEYLFTPNTLGWGVASLFAGCDIVGVNDPAHGTFVGLRLGVLAWTGPSYVVNIKKILFGSNVWGAYFMNSTGAEISGCTFTIPDEGYFAGAPIDDNAVGLVLHQSTNYIVEENDFHGLMVDDKNVGIYFIGTVLGGNQIYNNTFTDLGVGTLVYGRHKGYTPGEGGTEYQGLQILCGDYLGNVIDYGLAENSYIRQFQGTMNWNDVLQSQLAGNRWLDPADLVTNWDIVIDPVQIESGALFAYYRHDVSDCNPLNPGQYIDSPVSSFTNFVKEEACGEPLSPGPGPGPGPGPQVTFVNAAAQLESAKASFYGTVDQGLRVSIIDSLRHYPWIASHALRDMMLAKHPLSDEVLLEVIHREESMDAWHITQVMLDNARLTPIVQRALEESELLNEYMLGLVLNAGNGPTVKDLLRDEIEVRSTEKLHSQIWAMREIMGDTTHTDPEQGLYDMHSQHPDVGDMYYLAELSHNMGMYTEAFAWLDSLEAHRDTDHQMLRDLFNMHSELQNDWSNATSAEIEILLQMSEQQAPGAAMAKGVLFSLQATDDLPEVILPMVGTKSLKPGRATGRTATRTFLSAHPNPTNGTSWVVIDLDLDEAAVIRIHDLQSRLVQQHQLAPGQRLLEIDLQKLANGMYTCELLQGDLKLAATKITLQH